MIILEEKAYERILSRGFCDTAIPFSIRQADGDEPVITVMPSLKKTAVKFEKEFADNMFSPAAHAWITNRIAPFMDSIGYHENRQSRRISRIMSRDTSTDEINVKNAVILDNPIENLTSADVTTLIKFGHIVSAVILDKKIVSVAYTDLAPAEDTDALEVGVETAVGYRHSGYAKDALSNLILELSERDIIPIYISSEFNRPSLALARSLGFKSEGREYDCVFRRD